MAELNGTPCLVLCVRGQDVFASLNDNQPVEGRFDLDPLHRDIVAVFAEWLRQDKIEKKKEAQVLGTILFRALINGEVLDLVQQTVREAIETKEHNAFHRVRLELDFDEKRDASLPWEFLIGPLEDTDALPAFLSTSEYLTLSRRSAGRADAQPPPRALNVLLVVSQPPGIAPDNPERVGRWLRALDVSIGTKSEGLAGQASGLDEGEVAVSPVTILEPPLRNPTLESFEAALRTHQPDVVHFVGQGKQTEEGLAVGLACGDETLDADWVLHADFAQCFARQQKRPRLVFLHLCPGPAVAGRGDAYAHANFADLAYEVSRVPGIQAVVGMRNPIPIERDLTQHVTTKLYEGIMDHGLVGAAVQRGRQSAYTLSSMPGGVASLGKPVLYLSSSDLIRETRPLSGSDAGTSALSRPQDPDQSADGDGDGNQTLGQRGRDDIADPAPQPGGAWAL